MITKLQDEYKPPTNTGKSVLVDLEGNPIKFGKDADDPEIGPDDNPVFERRGIDDFADLPIQVKQAEMKYIMPAASFLAQSLGINLIDEKLYEKIMNPLMQRSLFVMLNLTKTKVADGIATWYGLILMCKKHPIVLTKFKLHLGSGRIGIMSLRLWNKRQQNYVIYGDREQKTFMDREKVAVQILNYLRSEGVCNV